ncbi:MAG: MerR family transcriptional regulator [Pseudomonadota bacterium]
MPKTPAAPAPKPRRKRASQATGNAEYTVDELARTGDATVRNVRAYQDRGLLPPPEKRGRTGIYTSDHLARLRLINQLLDRGYTLGNIAELIAAWEKGQNLRDLLGLESAITSPWSEELPGTFSMAEIISMFGKHEKVTAIPELVRRVTELGILQADGLRFRAPRPRLVHAAAQLVAMGIPLGALLDILRMLRGNVERVANELVQLALRYVLTQHLKDGLPKANEVSKIAELIWKLRPIADVAVDAEVARAMELAVQKYLGDILSSVFEQLPNQK